MPYSRTHKLSDGTTMRVRIVYSIAGTFFTEVHSLEGRKHSTTLYHLGTSMFMVLPGGELARITNPDYYYAKDAKAATEVALRFFVDSAEAVIKAAKEEGMPVIEFYDHD